MSIDNQNFIIGLVSAIGLVVGLIYTFVSIHKARLEIRKLNSDTRQQTDTSKNNSSPNPKHRFRISPLSIAITIDVFFFLFFSIASIITIIEYLNNKTPVLALIGTQYVVLIYSWILLADRGSRKPISPHAIFSKKERRFFSVLSWIGIFTALIFTLFIGIQRITSIFHPTYDDIFSKLFSLGVNLAIAPILAFSIVSLHRVIKYITYIPISQEDA